MAGVLIVSFLHHQSSVLDFQDEVSGFPVCSAQMVFDPGEKSLILQAGHYSAKGGSLTIRTQAGSFVLGHAGRCETMQDDSLRIDWHGL